ncbi:MAG: PIG-L family deacetylase, partial [Candidatus Omnitrophica bacterium]|nr:PIG-L family deacetylase [Candidatus Omnitrophota bacterium]
GAHPDDIEFGCGGTLMKLAKRGHRINMLILTKGGMGGNPTVRKEEQDRAAKFMDAKKVIWGNFKDTHIPSDKKVISVIEKAIKETDSEVVFINYYEDTHQDHRLIADNAIASSRYIKNVFFYEVPTTQRFEPDVFVDLSDILNDKLDLLKIHASQVSKTGVEQLSILESAKSCANFRGFQARVKYAEGFKSLRYLMEL